MTQKSIHHPAPPIDSLSTFLPRHKAFLSTSQTHQLIPVQGKTEFVLFCAASLCPQIQHNFIYCMLQKPARGSPSPTLQSKVTLVAEYCPPPPAITFYPVPQHVASSQHLLLFKCVLCVCVCFIYLLRYTHKTFVQCMINHTNTVVLETFGKRNC